MMKGKLMIATSELIDPSNCVFFSRSSRDHFSDFAIMGKEPASQQSS